MNNLTRRLFITIFVLLLFVGATSNFYAQKTDIADKDVNLADLKLENIHIKNRSIEQLFMEFSFVENIPFGLEMASNDRWQAGYEIDFKNGTLSEMLTQFVTKNPQYDWEVNDGVVNIFPKITYQDESIRAMLETNVSSFSIKENTNCRALSELIVSRSLTSR